MTRRKIFQTAAAVTAVALGLAAAFIIAVDPFGGVRPNPYNSTPAGEPPLLIEYADFNCPHCARFALTALPELERTYIATGKVRYEYRHYPFLTETSQTAAEAAECARDQGRFKAFHDSAYMLSITKEGPLTLDDIAGAAVTAGSNLQEIEACLAAGRHRATVQEHVRRANEDGIRGTPTLLLDGETLNWRDWDHLTALIDAGITKKELENQ